MELTDAECQRIAPRLPTPRGSLTIPHRQALNALLYVGKERCTWPGLPPRFGSCHTAYVRINRRAKRGVLERVWCELQGDQGAARHPQELSLDSTIVKLHAAGSGAPRKRGGNRSAARAAGWRPS